MLIKLPTDTTLSTGLSNGESTKVWCAQKRLAAQVPEHSRASIYIVAITKSLEASRPVSDKLGRQEYPTEHPPTQKFSERHFLTLFSGATKSYRV